MNPKHLQDAIGNIDDAFIAEAATVRRVQPAIWLPAAALAACVMLMASLLPWGTLLSGGTSSLPGPNVSKPAPDVLQSNDSTLTDSTKDPETDITDDSSVITNDTPQSSKPEDTNAPPVSPPSVVAPSDTEAESADREETTARPQKPQLPVVPPIGPVAPSRPGVLSRALYPVQNPYPSVESLRHAWRSAMTERISTYKSGIGNTDSFISRSVLEFLKDPKGENMIYSPVNTYMTLGMLAETAEGESRAQLLSLLGAADIQSLRSSASNLWNACYRDDGIVTTVLGNSLWLDDSFAAKTEVTDILAKSYYASSFKGDMGSEEYDALVRSWLNEQTRGLLGEAAKGASLDADSKMTLMSTVYYKAEWDVAFDPDSTRSRVFHSPEGDVTCDFMYRDFVGIRYKGSSFKATCLDLKEGETAWFILPNENVSLESLFYDSEAMGFITGKAQKSLSYQDHSAYMWLFLPKFDISSRATLKSGLENMGACDVFDPAKADLSPLCDSDISVHDITCTVRVSIDESGCEAASLSEGIHPSWPDGGTAPNEFTLDRPFIFVIISDSGLPLFVGTVNRPGI